MGAEEQKLFNLFMEKQSEYFECMDNLVSYYIKKYYGYELVFDGETTDVFLDGEKMSVFDADAKVDGNISNLYGLLIGGVNPDNLSELFDTDPYMQCAEA